MLKAIFAKHVRTGDDILLSGGERATAQDVEFFCGVVRFTSGERTYTLKEYDLVGLGCRPREEGTTEQGMLDAIFALASSLPGRMWPMSPKSRQELDEKLIRLRAALDAYELGKPGERP